MRGSLLAVAGLSALAAVAVSADEELANFPHLTVDRAARCYARTQPAAGYGSEGRTIVYEAAAARRAALRAFATGSPAWATSVLPDGEVRIRVMPPARDFDSTGDTVLHTFAWYAQELWLRCDEIGTPGSGLLAFGSFASGALLDAYGWDAVQYAMVPALILAAFGVVWLRARTRRASRASL